MRWVFAFVLAGILALGAIIGLRLIFQSNSKVTLDINDQNKQNKNVHYGTTLSACVVHGGPCDDLPTPNVEYPKTTERLPDADCDVSFGLDLQGKPVDIEVTCSHPAFVEASRKAILELEYPTEDFCGPCGRNGRRFYYPLRFEHE